MTEPWPWRRDAVALFSGYAYLALAGLATLLLGPLYLRLLGGQQWGEVALCLTLQGVLLSLEGALGPLLLREAARAASATDARAAFERFLRLYGGIAIALTGLLQLALFWLDAGALVAIARLALLQFLFQFANLAALGYWQGRQQQPRAYRRSAGFLLAKHALALLLMLRWQASGLAYFLPFALVAAIEFGINLRTVRAEAPASRSSVWIAGPVLPPAFALASLAAMPTAYVDRVWLAATLPPDRFGLYFLIGTLLLSLLHLQMPIQRAFLPRIAKEASPESALMRMRAVTLFVLVLPSLLLAVLADPFLRLWLGDAAQANDAATTLCGMMLAAVCLALAAPSQTRLLRDARYGALAALNATALAVQLGILAAFAASAGMVAGAAAWLGAGLVQLSGATWLTRPRREAVA